MTPHDRPPSDARGFAPRISPRTLLILVTLACVWLGIQVKRARDQTAAVALVRKLHGTIVYDDECKPGDLSTFSWNNPSPTPAWLRDTFGDGFFTSVVAPPMSDIERPQAFSTKASPRRYSLPPASP